MKSSSISAVAFAVATMFAGSALACAGDDCPVTNPQLIDDLATFWRLVRTSPDPETATQRVRAKFGAFPIDFVGDDHKHGGSYAHVVILGIKTDGIGFYSQAPVVNVDVSILAPTFSGPSRRFVSIVVGN